MDSDKVGNLLKRASDGSELLVNPTLKKHKEIDESRNDLDMKNEIIKKLQMNSDLLEISLKKMDDMSNRLNMVTDFVEKQQQKDSHLPVTSLIKKMDDMSNRLNMVTDFVEKQQQKDSELPATSLIKEIETPKEKESEYKCCFETNDYKMMNRGTIFVKGFGCSSPLDVIKRKLTEHFSSCGEVERVYLPHHCKTDSSLGYAFINMGYYENEAALKLDGTWLDGLRLEVTMARWKFEYHAFTNLRGCKSCPRNIFKRRREAYSRQGIFKLIL